MHGNCQVMAWNNGWALGENLWLIQGAGVQTVPWSSSDGPALILDQHDKLNKSHRKSKPCKKT